jgi:hypothetical protein
MYWALVKTRETVTTEYLVLLVNTTIRMEFGSNVIPGLTVRPV